jgi:hypothetical protein
VVTTTTTAPGQAPVTEAQMNEAVGQVKNDILKEMAEKEESAISIWATVQGEARWRQHGNLGNRNSGSTSELFLRDAEVGLEFRPTDYLTGRLVLKSEYLGTDTTDGGAEAAARAAPVRAACGRDRRAGCRRPPLLRGAGS